MKKILNIQPIVTSGYRPIKDGSKYDKYFPSIQPQQRMIVGDRTAEVDDVVELMKKVVWKYQNDTKNIASYLKSESTQQTIKNIWKFLYHHIQYKLDKSGLEELRRPARLWHDKIGDCDDYAMTASSILTNLGIPHSFRITKYGKDYFQHVYIVVPDNKGGHYVIDPVLSLPNYEKPFTEKKDFNMNLNGINVAVLSGLGDSSFDANGSLLDDMMLSGFDGIDGLGSLSQERANDKVYNNLVATRAYTVKNKTAVSMFTNADKYIKELDYAIKYWYTPQRQEALDILARNENIENQRNANSISGLGDLDFDSLLLDDAGELNGLGSWFSKKWKKLKKGHKKIWNTVKKGVKKGWKAVKKVTHAVLVKYNPAVMAIRGGILLVLKYGIFPFPKMKTRLKWAFASDAQLKKAGISKEYRRRNQKVLKTLEAKFVKFGGKRSNIKKAVLAGKKGRLSGFDDYETLNIQGLGDGGISAGAMVTAATAVLTFISRLFKKNKVGDPKKQPIISPKSTSSSGANPNAVNQDDIQALINAGAEVITKPDGTKAVKKPIKNADGTTSYETVPFNNTPTKAGFLSHLKNNPVVAIIGAGLLSGLAYMGYQAMSGKNSQKGIANGNRANNNLGNATSTKKKTKPQNLKIEKLK